jgi:hypothetical protein
MSVRILLRLELALLRLLSLLMRLEDELLSEWSEDRIRMLESPLESRHSVDLLGLMTRSGSGRVGDLFCSCSSSPRQVCLLWHKSQSELLFNLDDSGVRRLGLNVLLNVLFFGEVIFTALALFLVRLLNHVIEVDLPVL